MTPLFRQISYYKGRRAILICRCLLGAALAFVAGGACGSCSHGRSTNGSVEGRAATVPAPSGAPPVAAAGERVDQFDRCRGGSLPRFTERNLSDSDFPALLATAASRPIAVIWRDSQVELVSDCQLNGGPYVVIPGKKDRGQFRPSSRIVFRSDELEGACRIATHVVGAFAVDGPSDRSLRASTDASSRGPRHVAGLLVPLPCPSVADAGPAPGCIGRGLTGAQRLVRGRELWAGLPRAEGVFADIARPLELYALVPDHFWGLSLARWVEQPALVDQARWLSRQYDFGKIAPPPGLSDWTVDLYAADATVQPLTTKLKEASRRTPPPILYWNPYTRELMDDPAFMRCPWELVDPDFHHHVIF